MSQPNPFPEIIKLLEGAESKLTRARQKSFGKHGLTSPQISILLLLNKKGPLKINQIAEELQMIQSNASNICSRLEKADLIRRKRCEQDQRAVYVTLTEAARCQIAEIQTSVDQFHQTVSENITPQDFSDIKNGLIKLNRLFDLF